MSQDSFLPCEILPAGQRTVAGGRGAVVGGSRNSLSSLRNTWKVIIGSKFYNRIRKEKSVKICRSGPLFIV